MGLILCGYCAGKYYGFLVAMTIPYPEDSISQYSSPVSSSSILSTSFSLVLGRGGIDVPFNAEHATLTLSLWNS